MAAEPALSTSVLQSSTSTVKHSVQATAYVALRAFGF
jgi:hypothetical protein